MSEESIENLPEPQHASGSRYIERLQIVSHPAYWGPVLQAGDSEGNIMVPHWSELSEGEPIPKEASTPVPRDTVQNLFDSLWRQGYRPTGTRVTLENVAEEFPAYLQQQMETIANQMSINVGSPQHRFEYYWVMGETNSAVLWRHATLEQDSDSMGDSEAVEEFDSLDQIIEYVLKWNIQRCTGYENTDEEKSND